MQMEEMKPQKVYVVVGHLVAPGPELTIYHTALSELVIIGQ